jgi:flavodoxin
LDVGWQGRYGSKKTKIAPTKRVPAEYDLIIVGTPVWAWSPSAAIRTYLVKNDLSGKKVALFFTLDSNLRGAVEKTKGLAPDAIFIGELEVKKALENKEESRKRIADWCNTLKTQS